jgi:hypothetical protein
MSPMIPQEEFNLEEEDPFDHLDLHEELMQAN